MSAKVTRPNRDHFIGFRVDDDGYAALRELERAVGDGHGKRSQVIRRAIMEARERLRERK